MACVVGDDLVGSKESMQTSGITEMFSGTAFPPSEKVLSINAYLGAFPIAHALTSGADIVVTGRCVDSAVTLGACIHAFGWGRDDLDQLAMGSLAGSYLGMRTASHRWKFYRLGAGARSCRIWAIPSQKLASDGSFVCTKPEHTGGLVSVGTVSEQMLYEIGDPQAYMLPDVVCDFSTARIEQIGEDRVQVSGAKGRMAPIPTRSVQPTPMNFAAAPI